MSPDSLDLKNLLAQSKSPYIYRTEHSKERTSRDSSKQGKELSKHEVNYYWDEGYFTVSDLQLVKLVAENVFCSTKMLKKSLLIFRRNTENKDIAILSDESYLRDRLRVLVKCEMLIKYTLRLNIDDVANKDVEHYYCVSPHGYNYIKRQLYFNKKYDEYLSSLPVEEVFKYLSTVMACQSFSTVKGFEKYLIENSFYSSTLKKMVKLYGEVKVTTSSGKHVIIVEPLKFEYERQKITKQTWENLIVERFTILKEGLLEVQKENPDANISFMIVCNDLSGINKAASLAKTYLCEYLHCIYFVIDTIIEKYSFSSTCIQIDGNNKVSASTPNFV